MHDLAARFNGYTEDRLNFQRHVFCFSPACVGNSLGSFTLIRQGISHVVLARPPPVCRRHQSWFDPQDTCDCCGFPLCLKWPGGELDDSVSVGLPCHQRRDVHPFYLLLRRVVVATGERDPRNCIKVRPYEQLLTPSAVAGFHALRDQPSATAGAIVTAARRVKTFTCVL